MRPELVQLLDRMTTRRAAAWDAIHGTAIASSPFAARATHPFRAGDRVFDTVTGEEGEVVGRTTENIVVSAPAKRVG